MIDKATAIARLKSAAQQLRARGATVNAAFLDGLIPVFEHLHAEARTCNQASTVTPAMVAAALAVEPLTFAHQVVGGRALTEELRAENMRRVIQAALEARG